MASGRDDFIIAIRSAFLKKSNKQQFSLLALIIFSIVLIFLSNLNFIGIKYIKIGVNEATYRLSAIISFLLFPFVVYIMKLDDFILIFSFMNTLIILFSHKKNIVDFMLKKI